MIRKYENGPGPSPKMHTIRKRKEGVESAKVTEKDHSYRRKVREAKRESLGGEWAA